MPRNSSGTYTRPNNSFSEPVIGEVIDPVAADALFDDQDNALTDSLSRTGDGGMQADLLPQTDGGASLGSDAKKFADLTLSGNITARSMSFSDAARMRIVETGATSGGSALNPVVQIELTNYSNNTKRGLEITAFTNDAGSTINTGGIAATVYTPPDNGGDCSAIFAAQLGGGNAISAFNISAETPVGQTPYPNNGYAIEAATDGGKHSIISTTVDGINFFANLSGNGVGLLVRPSADTSLTRRAISVVSSTLASEPFSVDLAGKVIATNVSLTKAGNSALDIRSGASGSFAEATFGRTASELTVAVAGSSNQFIAGTAAGDAVVSAGTDLWLGTNGAIAAVGTHIAASGDLTLARNLLLPGSSSGSTTLKASAAATGTLTLPATTGTVAVSGSSTGSAALTKTDDTNVTLTLGGTPATALLQATSLTLGWTGTLALSRLAQGTDGQLIVGQTSASPLYKSITGDWTLSAAGAATLATVNSNVGTFGSATQSVQFTVNAKGLVTAAANVTVTPAVGSITGFGTGVATALAVNVGSAGAFVTFNGAGGTPSSLTLTNATGLPLGSITGLGTGVATALAVNVGTAGAVVVNGGALGSPSSAGTIPAFTLGGTIAGGGNQINNVIIGNSTPLAGSFTTLSATGAISGASLSSTSDIQINRTGDDVSVGSFLSTNLTNGHFVQFSFGKAASSNNSAIFKWTQDATVSTFGIQMFGDASPFIQGAKGGAITFPLLGTTASAANAFLDSGSNNNLLRSTSVLAAKNIGEPLTPSMARDMLLSVGPEGFRGFIYTSRCEADDPDLQHVGFAAEWEEVIDKRFVQHDAEGKPSGVAYERYVVPLTVGFGDHETRLERVERMLADLSKKLGE